MNERRVGWWTAGHRSVSATSTESLAVTGVERGMIRMSIPSLLLVLLGVARPFAGEGPSDGWIDHPDGWHFREYEGEDHARNPLPRDPEPLPREELESLAKRADTEFPWAGSLEEALARAKEQGRAVVQIVRDADLRSVLPFAPDTLELLKHRFVVVEKPGRDSGSVPQQGRGGTPGTGEEEELDSYASNRMGMGWSLLHEPPLTDVVG
jgi:hypothetical protein